MRTHSSSCRTYRDQELGFRVSYLVAIGGAGAAPRTVDAVARHLCELVATGIQCDQAAGVRKCCQKQALRQTMYDG